MDLFILMCQPFVIHTYGKIINVPTETLKNDNNTQLKCSPIDFVLWKAAKHNEPFWESKWGPGRPGWYIECSTMSSHIFGNNFDLHTGGSDLKFPHHENEIAQSEAAFNTNIWAKYWMHSGFLTINGHKMSKSLKKYVSIRDVLRTYTARQIRTLF